MTHSVGPFPRAARQRAEAFLTGFFCLAISASCAFAQSTSTDGPTMKNVNDVLNGQAYLLPQDDVGLLVASYPVQGNSNLLTQFFPFNSTNSVISQQPAITLNNSNGPAQYTSSSTISSTASGRMFNNGNDVVISLVTEINTNNYQPTWAYSYYNPKTNSNQGPYVLASGLEPNAPQINSRVVMGDFQGTHLSCPLLYVESDFNGYTLWGMNIVAPPNVNQVDVIDPYGGGPQYSTDATSPSQRPIPSTIVTGDFNNDGIDEIAAIMADGLTIQLYQVNPATLQITPYQSFKLPFALGPAALAAGHFGLDTNVVLAAVGQQTTSTDLYAFYINPRFGQPVQPGTLLPAASDYYGGVNFSGILAQAAPVTVPQSTVSEQLVLGLQFAPPHKHNTGFVWFGTFDTTNNYVYNLQGASDLVNESGCLLDMKVSNFNELDDSGNVANALQVSVLENYGSGGDYCTPPFQGGRLAITTFNITVPSAVIASPTAAPIGGVTSWASQVSYLIPNVGPYSNLQSVQFVKADLQGRSLRLGSPEKITLQTHIQPDLVLGMPPMHVDWINPYFLGQNNCEPGTPGASAPECILNLTVKPYGVSADQTVGFTSSYQFSNGETVSSSRKSSTSWGLSAKVTVGASFKYSVPDEASQSASITSTTKNSYNNVHSTYDKQYNGFTETLQAQTGFDDFVFYTSENQNIYNYPVLGETDKNGNPVYVSFSVPSSVEYTEISGSSQEWYQPVHEPGNVLSYPWSWDLIQSQQPSGVATQLATSNCLAVGSVSDSTGINWTQGNSSSSTSGWSDTLSSDLNVSYSYSVGGTLFGAGAEAKLSGDIDIGGSGSWSTLNQSSTSLSSGQAINLTVPQFDKSYTTQFAYAFQNYVFGIANPQANQPGLQPDGTYQGGNTLFASTPQITATGPLFIGYAANPTAGGPGLSCGQSGASWWGDAYHLPDVGFNHPSRWDVSTANVVSFNQFQPPSANSPLMDQLFYQMKGLWITRQGQSGDPANVGSTLGEATAGDQLTLTARIYNFSLVATNKAIPNSAVHVRFYGQKKCDNVSYPNGQVADLCPNGAILIPSNGRDGDFVINSIPGFNQGTTPNYALASVSFDTTGYDYSELIFWAVTWIEDANGNVVPEMPGHGVTTTSFAGKTFANINNLPLEMYSNNVGMFGTYSPFYVGPATRSAAPPGSTPSPIDQSAPLESVKMSLPSKTVPFDKRTRLAVTFQAGAAFPGSRVSYYDGNPASGGKLFDFQRVHRLAAGQNVTERLFYRPTSCGTHTLYAVSDVEGTNATIGKLSTRVTIDAAATVRQMTSYLTSLEMDRLLKKLLLLTLHYAELRFEEHETARGLGALRVFQEIAHYYPQGTGTNLRDQVDTLLARAHNITTCEQTLEKQPGLEASAF